MGPFTGPRGRKLSRFILFLFAAAIGLFACSPVQPPPTNTAVFTPVPPSPTSIPPTKTQTATPSPVPTETSSPSPQVEAPTQAAIETAPIPTPDSPENVLFTSNIGAEYIGYSLYFHFPRFLEVGYFSDSGAYGWLLSDSNPNEVFWSSNQTGNELLMLMMLQPNAGGSIDVNQKIEAWEEDLPSDTPIHRIIENDVVEGAFYLYEGETRGVLVSSEIVFTVFGTYPAEKEVLAEMVMITLLTSAGFPVETNLEAINYDIWGTRFEGLLEAGVEQQGYLPVASGSVWDFVLEDGNRITLNLDTGSSSAVLQVDILDESGDTVLPTGAFEVFGSTEGLQIELPGPGRYQLQIHWGDPDWYGWYQVAIE